MKTGLTPAEFAQELDRQERQKRDYLVPRDRIHFVTDADNGQSEVDLLGLPGHESTASSLRMTDVSHGQFAEKLDVPKRFYDRLRTTPDLRGLFDQNVNTLLHRRPGNNHPAPNWLIRTLGDDNGGGGICRAALSDQYLRIDNAKIARILMPVLQDIPGITIRSCNISDKYMYLKAVTPRVQGQVRVGQDVAAGIMIRNSEVGYGKFVVTQFVETLQCTNGMVVTRPGTVLERIHLGPKLLADEMGRIYSEATLEAVDNALMLEARDIVRNAVDATRFAQLVAQMADAAKSERIQDVGAAVELLREKQSLPERTGAQILQFLAEGGDLSQWGLVSAITRTAEEQESYDAASDLEELGGKIMDLSGRQWAAYANATT